MSITFNQYHPKSGLLTYLKDFWKNQSLGVTKSTPIVSMGSCFAREVKLYLMRHGYNYLCEETERPAALHASCAWERVYNTFSMRQIFDYTFDDDWEMRWYEANGLFQDSVRNNIYYSSHEEAVRDFANHRRLSAQVLKACDLFVLTLGLTEIWQSNVTGKVWPSPAGVYAKVNPEAFLKEFEFRVSTFEENLDNLNAIVERFHAHNPDATLLLTVSPVSLLATRRTDVDLFSANINSKATLRAVADVVLREYDFVQYFPSYEITTVIAPTHNIPPFDLNHPMGPNHVHDGVVDLIMKTFEAIHLEQS
jgi:hypothetical protein